MKVQHIFGADISKRTIDLFCDSHFSIENNKAGFKQMIRWLKQQNVNTSEAMIVMEHTGLYSYRFEDFLYDHHIAFSKVSGLTVKRSIGLARGKSDKIDARRLRDYGIEKQGKLSIEMKPSKELQRLSLLHTSRERLVRHKAALLNAISEYKNIGLTESDVIIAGQRKLVKTFEKQIAELEDAMDQVIKENPSIQQNRQLLQSIKGVGKVVSMATIVKTKNFTRFSTARQFACYCGTAPFEHTSGTSIKGKTRVSDLADKAMKTLLDLAAKVAIQHDKELRQYYARRTEIGKSKMSTINIIRNKIIYRMFAVVKRQTPFVENYLQTA